MGSKACISDNDSEGGGASDGGGEMGDGEVFLVRISTILSSQGFMTFDLDGEVGAAAASTADESGNHGEVQWDAGADWGFLFTLYTESLPRTNNAGALLCLDQG